MRQFFYIPRPMSIWRRELAAEDLGDWLAMQLELEDEEELAEACRQFDTEWADRYP